MSNFVSVYILKILKKTQMWPQIQKLTINLKLKKKKPEKQYQGIMPSYILCVWMYVYIWK